jgi:hypothetical protein
MQDFLNNIFSRGSQARTDHPVVSIGGISSNSASLTYDVAHFDQTGNLLVNVAVGGAGGGGGSISGTVTAVISGGTLSALIAGTMTVQAVLAGTMTALAVWTQRLDASNDAILSYGSVRTSDIAGLMAASGSNIPMITDSLGKQVVLPGAVNDLHLDGQVATPGVLATVLITNQGAGKRIAMQSIIATGSASALANVIISGGPNSRTFGLLPIGYGGFTANAGGAPLYITSASAALSVACDSTVICNIFASGYSMSN